MPQKASPYHNPQHRNDLEKIALGKDMLEVQDLGLVPSEETGNHPFTTPSDRRNTNLIDEAREEKKDKQDEREMKKMEVKQNSQPPKEKSSIRRVGQKMADLKIQRIKPSASRKGLLLEPAVAILLICFCGPTSLRRKLQK